MTDTADALGRALNQVSPQVADHEQGSALADKLQASRDAVVRPELVRQFLDVRRGRLKVFRYEQQPSPGRITAIG